MLSHVRLFATPFSVASVHGILQARIMEWVAIPFSRGSSQPKDRIRVSCIADGFFTIWATSEAPKGMGHSQSKMITIILTKTIITAITEITTNYHNNLHSLSLQMVKRIYHFLIGARHFPRNTDRNYSKMSFGNWGNDSILTQQFLKSRPQLRNMLQESIFKGRFLLRESFVIIIGFLLLSLLKKDADISLSTICT